MPDNATGCPLQTRPEQAVPVHLQRDTQQQSCQNDQLCLDQRTSLRPSQAPCPPSTAPLMHPLPQLSAHFPHRMIQDPRGFLLGRFANAGRPRTKPHPHTTARIGKPSPYRTFVAWWSLQGSFRKPAIQICCRFTARAAPATRWVRFHVLRIGLIETYIINHQFRRFWRNDFGCRNDRFL